jgi:hypothetical protein
MKTTPTLKISESFASDDSCQFLLLAKGHHDADTFRQACRVYIERNRTHVGFAEYAAPAVRHVYYRTVPSPGNIVCDSQYVESRKGRGAWPVTILDGWLPLFAPRKEYLS